MNNFLNYVKASVASIACAALIGCGDPKQYETKTGTDTTTITTRSGSIEQNYEMTPETHSRFQRMVADYQVRKGVRISERQLANAVVRLDADFNGTVSPQEAAQTNLERVLDEVTR